MPKQKRAGKLLEILLMRDDELVPVFCRALVDSDQQHVARELGLFCYLFYIFSSLIK